MMLHQYIQDELINNKSLSALVYLIEHGRELEFIYNDEMYFISRDNSAKYVSLWKEKEQQSFDSITKLIEKSNIQEKSLLEIWSEVQIRTLF